MSQEKQTNPENTNAKTPNFGRAFNACLNSDWLMTQDALKQMLAIAARLNDPKAVEAYREDTLKDTRTVKIRNGVAIIPITGPIFRYANLFTYYSGGTTVSQLAKDFRQALDNPGVYSIMFEINSPGGEVAGINELGDMIYAARKKKPMTARVGFQMCSAALWLGVQAGDVVIDQTAIIGSIGVCTTYLDDRKFLEMRGLEELEFISSQSPYKNAAPYTDEGRQRIQKRLDDLCQVFGEKVGRGRGVTIKTVWDKFGQGDVFVGKAAIECGLADRFGSYEETVDLLARAHTPNYSGVDPDEDEEPFVEPYEEEPEDAADDQPAADAVDASTIKNEAAVTFNADEATASENPNDEEFMKDKETENTSEAAAQDGTKNLPAPTVDAAALEERERALAEREKVLNSRETAAAALEKEAQAKIRRAEFEKVAESFAGDEDAKGKKVAFMEKLADSFGEDSAELADYVKDQETLAAQIETGALFEEKGKPGEGESASAEDQLDKLAKERAAEKGITYEKAYTEVLEENQVLFAETQKVRSE